MKKSLLAIVFSAVALPLTFAAQAPASPAPTDSMATTKTTKKHTKKSTTKKTTAAPAAGSATPKQ